MAITKIRPDDFEYGSRSGIQKGIRRGNLDLVKTCFDALWAVPKQRTWLKWRSTTLVMEEAWQMIGELAELKESKSSEREHWRKLLYKLTLASKSKDAVGLWFLTDLLNNLPAHPEFDEMAFWRHSMIGRDPSSIAVQLSEHCQRENLSGYEKRSIDHLRERTFMGGMLGDRCICLAGMILINQRGLEKVEVIDDIKEGKEKWVKRIGEAKIRNPKTLDLLPWYCFDIHTQCGKIARSIFMKHRCKKYPGLDEKHFRQLWFNLESAYTPPDLLHLRTDRPFDNLTSLQSAWYLPLLRLLVRYKGHKPKEAIKMWKEGGIRKDIKECVEWIVSQRGEGKKPPKKPKEKRRSAS